MPVAVRQRLLIFFQIFVTILALSNLGRLAFLTLFRQEAVRSDAATVIASLLTGLRFDVAAFALLFTFPLLLFFAPWRSNILRLTGWGFILTLHFLWVAVLFGDIVFYAISHRRAAAEFVALFASWRDFWSFVTGSAVYILIGLPMGILPFYLLYRKKLRSLMEPIRPIYSLVLVVVIILAGIIAVRGGLQGRPLNVTHAFVAGDYFWGNVTLNPVFATLKLAYTGDALPQNKALGNLPQETIRGMVAAPGESFPAEAYTFFRKTGHKKAESLKKNVVIFIMESWSAGDLGWFGNKYKATPFFDSLAAEGVSFENAYALGSRSITAIPTIVSSVTSMFGRPYTTSSYAHNKQRGMGTIFAEQGYSTYFVAGYKAGAQGFSTYMRVAGFENIITRENLGVGPEKSDGVWGVYDHHTFTRLHEILSQETRPFIAVVPSLHPHHPYRLPEDYQDKNYYRDIERAGHFNALRYSDFAISRFLALARNAPYFKDTIFVFTADHTYTQNGVLAKYHIPLVFYAPYLLKPAKKTVLASQLDILPTLIDLLKFETTHASMGKSVWASDVPQWAILDLDTSMVFLTEKNALMVNREQTVGFYDTKTDREFSRNLQSEQADLAEFTARKWYSYMNAVTESISRNRIAPPE